MSSYKTPVNIGQFSAKITQAVSCQPPSAAVQVSCQVMQDLWRTKWPCGKISPSTRFLLPILIIPAAPDSLSSCYRRCIVSILTASLNNRFRTKQKNNSSYVTNSIKYPSDDEMLKQIGTIK